MLCKRKCCWEEVTCNGPSDLLGTDRSIPWQCRAAVEQLGTVQVPSWLSLALLHKTSLVEEGTVPFWSSLCARRETKKWRGAGRAVASLLPVLAADWTAVQLQRWSPKSLMVLF